MDLHPCMESENWMRYIFFCILLILEMRSIQSELKTLISLRKVSVGLFRF